MLEVAEKFTVGNKIVKRIGAVSDVALFLEVDEDTSSQMLYITQGTGVVMSLLVEADYGQACGYISNIEVEEY
jgi:hypothetical protein